MAASGSGRRLCGLSPHAGDESSLRVHGPGRVNAAPEIQLCDGLMELRSEGRVCPGRIPNQRHRPHNSTLGKEPEASPSPLPTLAASASRTKAERAHGSPPAVTRWHAGTHCSGTQVMRSPPTTHVASPSVLRPMNETTRSTALESDPCC